MSVGRGDREPVARVRAQWQRWRSTAACAGVGLLGATALVWLADRSQHTELGQALDQAGMDIVVGDEAATRRLVGVLGNVSLGSIAVAVALLVGVAWVRRQYAAAVAAGALVISANATTQVVKAVSERSDFGYLTVTSFPSGHTTVVVSLVFAALLVVPGQARTTVSLLGSGAVTVTAAATLVASWHRPADILGAILVCLAWGTGVLTIWSLVRGGMPGTAPGREHRIFAVTGVGLAVSGLLAVGVRPDTGWSGFLDAGVVLAGVALVTALAVTTFAQLSAPMAAGAPVPRTGAGRHDA
ncbi:phosphatase PAP2 family protein [Nocardioides eburneiflavus]|uniref:Phosphatase PAP2 family protein n=1 Tax=Nocardioides eburneiflavus TaxID=2518372 RepID=A0A4Z1CCG7_9ACTN|nr:phosphatase PAP2 family protein [Nocardioides eburneiflavus]TGN63265.1 phosphatase PAP2 family protein [Nocardioides eburneiflavus]